MVKKNVAHNSEKKQDYDACLRLDIHFIIFRKSCNRPALELWKYVWIWPSFGAITQAAESNPRRSEMNMRTQTIVSKCEFDRDLDSSRKDLDSL